MKRILQIPLIILLVIAFLTPSAFAWFDETHLAIAKVAGYSKWYNAAAADVARAKIKKLEGYNHYSNNLRETVITPEMVLQQAELYDKPDPKGHLYGAIVGSLRAYQETKQKDRYAENLMAWTAHYIGDLSMPLHHMMYNDFNKKYHLPNDGVIEDEVLGNLDKIPLYEINIESEADLAEEIARIANLSKDLGYKLEEEDRLMTKDEAYQQLGHSASLLKAVLEYAGGGSGKKP
jgi:hypothetical protein